MRILFLLLSYPEPHQPNNLYSDLIDEFADNGHEVVIATALREGQVAKFGKEKKVEILRIKTMKLFRVSFIAKGIANARLPYQFKRAINKYLKGRHFDLICTPTPPITFVDIISSLKRSSHAKCCLILRDIFPQNAVDLGIIKNPLLFAYYKRKEKRLYQLADFIGCMSPGNINYVKKHNPEVDPNKLFLLPNWTKLDAFPERNEKVKEQFGLKDKYVVIFGGNIGIPQKIENIVSLAKAYVHNPHIVFFIVGTGTEKGRFERLVAENNLTNVIIKDRIPRDEYDEIVRNADVGLISLSEKFTIPNIPSKTLSYFNARIPILAAIDANTDYGNILEEANAGLWSVTGDLEKYKQNFDLLYNDAALRRQMGENGYAYLLKHLTSDKAYQAMIEHISI